jgi:predicted amidohydrolase YtcJ
MSAEAAILSARIRTLDPGRPVATAVAWRDGRILAVGDDAEIRAACDASTELLDGRGLTVTPGLVDAHLHPFFVEQTRGADLTRCAALAEVQDALVAERARGADGDWVLGWGLEYGVFGDDAISGDAIAGAVGGAPTLVTFMDQHTAVATPAALERAGLVGGESFAEGAEVVVADGIPTGELREFAAVDRVRAMVPPLSEADRRDRAAAFVQRLNRLGVTGAHVMNGDRRDLALVASLEDAGRLTARLVVPLWQRPEMSDDDMDDQLSLRDAGGARWRCGVAKFFIDGVVEAGTAWLYEPDAHGAGTRPFWPDPERYDAAVRRFAGAGFQCVTHAVGDRAVRAALDAYAAAARLYAPHRIEHVETLQPQDLARFAPEGVAASMQPLHMQWREPDGSDQWTSRLGPERAARAFPTRDLLDRRVMLALGSDWPVADCDPRVGMAWARLRRAPGRRETPAFEPEQRLSGEEALRGYTTSAAEIVAEGHLNGRVAVGLRADLTAFGGDPVDCDADDLPSLPVAVTVVDGDVVFRADVAC